MDTVKLSSVKPNPDNPRTIRDTQFHALVESIKRDPQFLDKRGIVHADGVILGGNMRYRAIQEALKDAEFRAAIGVKSAKEVPAAWVLDASEWTEQQRRRFVIVDNAPPGIAGDWDIDALANAWDDMPLAEWGLAPEVVDLWENPPPPKPPKNDTTKVSLAFPAQVWLTMQDKIGPEMELIAKKYGGEYLEP